MSATPRSAGQPAGDQVAERLLDAFNRRDVAAALALLHGDVVFLPVSARLLADGRAYRGHEGIRRYLDDVAAHWRRLEVTPVQVRAAGDAVVALGHVRSITHAGRADEASATWVFKLRDGLIAQIQIFSDERLVRHAVEDINRA
jgi:ketosteroid isomerase-like protein